MPKRPASYWEAPYVIRDAFAGFVVTAVLLGFRV